MTDDQFAALALILGLSAAAYAGHRLIRLIARREIERALKAYIVAGLLRPRRDARGRFTR